MQLQIVTTRQHELAELEAVIEANSRSFTVQAGAFETIQDERRYEDAGYRSFGDYMLGRWSTFEGGERHVREIKAATRVVENLGAMAPLPVSERQCRPLTSLSPEDQREVWGRVLRAAVGEKGITAKVVTTERDAFLAELAARGDDAVGELPSDVYAVDAWNALSDQEQLDIILSAPIASDTRFNRTNENVEWARWTWNPVTGCDHGCDYCYARVLANRYYTELPADERFAPVFRPSRLHAPRRMRVPHTAEQWIGEKNVFVCSMADLFGKWVPQGWIDAVFDETLRAPDWNFLFLTKFPQRLAEQDWPENAWVGASVDRQARVATAERSFRDVEAGVRWLSCEPMLEPLRFSDLSMFDWVVIGSQSANVQVPDFQPDWQWVDDLVHQARDAGCKVFQKPNLRSLLREYPGARP